AVGSLWSPCCPWSPSGPFLPRRQTTSIQRLTLKNEMGILVLQIAGGELGRTCTAPLGMFPSAGEGGATDVSSPFSMESYAMVTFIGMLMCGQVAGFMMEQQWGSTLLRWTRQHRMRMRVLRR